MSKFFIGMTSTILLIATLWLVQHLKSAEPKKVAQPTQRKWLPPRNPMTVHLIPRMQLTAP